MRTRTRHHPPIDRALTNARVVRLVVAVESFVARLGAELSDAQRALDPRSFAAFVETLGIGRVKVDRIMGAARLLSTPVAEHRPSAWAVLFGRLEPIPMLPGEIEATVDAAVAQAEPPEYARRADLLSADGLVYMMLAMHQPEALSPEARVAFVHWLGGGSPGADALAILRGWSATESGRDVPKGATREATSAPQEAPQ